MPKKISLFILFFIAIAKFSFATHIVGGNLELASITSIGFNYRITLNFYFDVMNGNVDAEQDEYEVSVFGLSNNEKVASYMVTKNNFSFINYPQVLCQNKVVKTKIITYSKPILVKNSDFKDPIGYYWVAEVCCRNVSIKNISNPLEAGNSFYLETPPFFVNGKPYIDNSPIFLPQESDYACLNKNTVFKIQATDSDGDSLVYRLVTPYSGHANGTNPLPSPMPKPYIPVNWLSNYNFSSPFGDLATIDQKLGVIIFTPKSLGTFVFSFECEEYRDKKKIGVTRKDMQIVVIECFTMNKPEISFKDNPPEFVITSLSDTCVGLVVKGNNDNLNLKINTYTKKISSKYYITSPSNLYFQTDSSIISSPKVCFKKCLGNDFRDTIMVVAEINRCNSIRKDTAFLPLNVSINNSNPTLTSNFQNDTSSVEIGDSMNLEILLKDNDLKDNLTLNLTSTYPDQLSNILEKIVTNSTGEKKYIIKWKPTCSDFNKGEYSLNFNGSDRTCLSNHQKWLKVKIKIKDKPYFLQENLIPNLFTPNGDGINDVFSVKMPENNCSSKFLGIEIVNRWGNLVFSGTNKDFIWDGSNSPEGMYYYFININNKKIKGFVQILR